MGLTVVIAEVLLVASLSSCLSSAASVYYVKPTPDTECPGNPCFTLSEYAQNVSQYFTSNGTFEFLPGNHSLDRDITVFDVSSVSISFIGERSNASQVLSWITCTEPAFFNFTRVQEIKVDALGFRSCGRGTQLPRALYFDSVHHFSIENSLFEHNLDTTLLVSLSSGTVENVSFINNTASQYGGAVLLLCSSLFFSGVTTFSWNQAGVRGGAIYAEGSLIEFLDAATFRNNMVPKNVSFTLGGAIALGNSTTLLFRGATTFLNNTAFQGGGIGAFANSIVHSNDNITFLQNSAGAGGAMFITQNSTIELAGDSNFTGNVAVGEGSMFSVLDSQVLLNGTNIFNNNHVNNGFGGIFINRSNLQIEGNTVFSYNSASVFGGAMFILFGNVTMSGMTLFADNTAGAFGGALVTSSSSFSCSGLTTFDGNVAPHGGAINMLSLGYLSFTGTTVFTNNICTGVGGGAITAYVGHITFNGTTTFDSNQAPLGLGGAIFSDRGNISFTGTGELSNNICHDTGGAMHLRGNSIISFNGLFHFRENHALQGGAISIEQNSFLSFVSPVQLVFTDNQAMYGGAIFVVNSLTLNYCTGQPLLSVCFFEVLGTINDVHLTFTDNTAEVAGSVLYGGLLQSCTIFFVNTSRQQAEAVIIDFQNISNITSHVITSEISSDPVRICFCQNNTYNCTTELPLFYRSPGQLFNFSVVAVDQTTNPVPALIRATFSVESTAELGAGEQTQDISTVCSSLKYRVFSSNVFEVLTVAAVSQCHRLGTALQSVLVQFLPCPNGFELVGDRCICEERLTQLLTTCDVETYSIEKVKNFWVNASYSSNGSYEGLIIHPDCPFDYCQAGPVNFTLSDPDAQCAFNRSGFLCGGCDSGFSLTLGSSQCAQCSNRYLALLIAFAALGVGLVLVISLCELTVGVGTVNGLIFYANIVGINQTIFFPKGDANVLTVFIAWVNLDFGIKTCFFDGLNSYTRTWLQFVFPFYVWLLVVALILASKCSVRLTQFLGTTLPAVLATLFLLSYAKLLRTIITIFYAAFLEYPDGTQEIVWLVDGNIRYLHGQHIPLFVFALVVLIMLFLPYTLLLLFGQWLQAKSEFKVLSWMNNPWVKYFLDAYYGPYKPHHRYWTGFLLFIRCALFLVFAFNVLGDASLNLLVIASSMLGVTSLTRLTKGIYKGWILDLLEASYFLNLGVLAAGTYYVQQAGGNQAALAYVSVGIAFFTFIVIATVQAYKQFKGTRLGQKIPGIPTRLPRRWQYNVRQTNDPVINEQEYQPVDAGDIPINAPTVSAVREPLLDESY